VITEVEFDKAVEFYVSRYGDRHIREDIRLRGKARELGYTIEYGDSFGDSLRFRRGDRIIRRGIRSDRDSVMKVHEVWVSSDGGHYDTLEEALEG